MMFVNNGGPAFVLATVGGAFLNDIRAGMIIYFSHIIVSILTAFSLSFFAPRISGNFKKSTPEKVGIKSNNGGKQLAQTSVKAVCNTVGWAAGETLAIWGFAKAGAAIGTALGPGIGTIAGAAIGFLGGSIGMWLGGKLGKGLMGNDVSNKIEAEKLAQSSEGQVQLLQHALEQAQSGAKMDLRTQQALQSAITQLA